MQEPEKNEKMKIKMIFGERSKANNKTHEI